MFGLKYGPRKMTLEKPLVGRFRLPSVRSCGKAPNRELPPKSGDITCMGMSIKDLSDIFGLYLNKDVPESDEPHCLCHCDRPIKFNVADCFMSAMVTICTVCLYNVLGNK